VLRKNFSRGFSAAHVTYILSYASQPLFVNGTDSKRVHSARGFDEGQVAERWVGSVRRDLLDHVIVLNERHLRRLLKDYVRYYHEDRTHLGLGKDTPGDRVAASVPPRGQKVISLSRLGGLHHRYAVAA
jgi:hypothetical protein